MKDYEDRVCERKTKQKALGLLGIWACTISDKGPIFEVANQGPYRYQVRHLAVRSLASLSHANIRKKYQAF